MKSSRRVMKRDSSCYQLTPIISLSHWRLWTKTILYWTINKFTVGKDMEIRKKHQYSLITMYIKLYNLNLALWLASFALFLIAALECGMCQFLTLTLLNYLQISVLMLIDSIIIVVISSSKTIRMSKQLLTNRIDSFLHFIHFN